MRGASNYWCSKPICEDSIFSFTLGAGGGGGGAVVFFNCEKRFERLFGPNKSQNIIENNNIIVFMVCSTTPSTPYSNNLIRHHKFQDSSQGFNSLINSLRGKRVPQPTKKGVLWEKNHFSINF